MATRIENYTGTISGATTGNITQATHGLPASRRLRVTFLDSSGRVVNIAHTIAANGDISWTSSDSFTGSVLVTR